MTGDDFSVQRQKSGQAGMGPAVAQAWAFAANGGVLAFASVVLCQGALCTIVSLPMPTAGW